MSDKREIILNTFQKLIFEKFGSNLERINNIKPDASERNIYRLFTNGNSFIGIYNKNEKENLAFINFTKTFIELGFNVPMVINVSDDNLFYIEEDLGDMTLFKFSASSDKENLFAYYKQALSDLIRFQVEAKNQINYNFCYQTKEFNSEVLKSDIEKFNDYFTKRFSKETFDDETIKSILKTSIDIISKTDNNYFLYRDFQPRNIMIKKNQLYYIDYQSGRKGPLQYDVASFLYSGSIDISEDERKILFNYYIIELEKYISFDEKEFKYYFYYFAFIRLLQVLGSYAYLYEKRNNKEVLNKIPKALFNLKTLLGEIDNIKLKNFIINLTVSIN